MNGLPVSPVIMLFLHIVQNRSYVTLVPLPMIKDVLGTLKNFSDDLLGTMQEIADINVELEYPDRVRVDNIEEVGRPIMVDYSGILTCAPAAWPY